MMLLSPRQVTDAWEAYMVEFDYLRDYVSSATDVPIGGLLDVGDRHIVRCRQAIEQLKQVVQGHLASGRT
jgi:hypothetical protein